MDARETDDVYSVAIGKFVISFSHLESVFFVISDLIIPTGNQSINKIIIGKRTFRDTVKFTNEIARIRFVDKADILEKIDKAVISINNLIEYRNTLIHSAWVRKENEPNVLFRAKVNDIKFEPILEPLQNIQTQTEVIRSLFVDLFDIAETIYALK